MKRALCFLCLPRSSFQFNRGGNPHSCPMDVAQGESGTAAGRPGSGTRLSVTNLREFRLGRLAAHYRSDFGRQQLDSFGDGIEWQSTDINLADEALVPKKFMLVQQLIDDLLRTPSERRTSGTGARTRSRPTPVPPGRRARRSRPDRAARRDCAAPAPAGWRSARRPAE